MEAKLYNQAGAEIGTLELDDYIFGIEPNTAVMHQAVVRQQANARLGTHNTRGRGEVKGSTRKIYRQKGTGRARQGSIRAPHHAHGGVAHGPHPRSYYQAMPRKMRRLAVRSALSAKVAAGEIRFVESITFEQPRTKDMLAFLSDHGIEGKVLILLAQKSESLQKSASNLPNVKTMLVNYTNVRDLLRFNIIVMPSESITVLASFLSREANYRHSTILRRASGSEQEAA
ncbi:MAG: 50S ribosomal protein L4 [Chloroflexales bacterium]|nr:50S ribosomal protein L4 [Chloroflexales bacterium]